MHGKNLNSHFFPNQRILRMLENTFSLGAVQLYSTTYLPRFSRNVSKQVFEHVRNYAFFIHGDLNKNSLTGES